MQIIPTKLAGVLLIEPRIWGDERGFFLESYHRSKYFEAGIRAEFVQDNHSKSSRGTLRGLHFQKQKPQGKLCRVTQGEVWDVAVDIRRGSPNFGQWTGAYLSEKNQRQIWVPRGFAHGFVVLSETAEFLYKCDEFYDPSDEGGIAWNDPDLQIEWPIEFLKTELLLSEKDKSNAPLRELETESLPLFQV